MSVNVCVIIIIHGEVVDFKSCRKIIHGNESRACIMFAGRVVYVFFLIMKNKERVE